MQARIIGKSYTPGCHSTPFRPVPSSYQLRQPPHSALHPGVLTSTPPDTVWDKLASNSSVSCIPTHMKIYFPNYVNNIDVMMMMEHFWECWQLTAQQIQNHSPQ